MRRLRKQRNYDQHGHGDYQPRDEWMQPQQVPAAQRRSDIDKEGTYHTGDNPGGGRALPEYREKIGHSKGKRHPAEYKNHDRKYQRGRIHGDNKREHGDDKNKHP